MLLQVLRSLGIMVVGVLTLSATPVVGELPVFDLYVEEHPIHATVVTPKVYDSDYSTSLLKDDLACVRDGVFDAATLREMAHEGALLDKYAREQRRDGQGLKIKTHAWWLDFDQRGHGAVRGGAGFGIERAIERLLHYDYPNTTERRRVGGAEWWVKIQSHYAMTQTLHFDKDEALSREGKGFRCPMASTVTYLTSGGAPTFIVNRTSPDGTTVMPLVPSRAAIVYPLANRHVLFRAHLQHGIVGSLAAAGAEPPAPLNLAHLGVDADGEHQGAVQRYTLLVNFWETKPGAPECQRLDAGARRQLGAMRALHGARWAQSQGGNAEGSASTNAQQQQQQHHTPGPVRALERVDFKPDAAVAPHIVDMVFRNADLLRFPLPRDFDRRALGAWDVVWEPHQVQTGWCWMDLGNARFARWWRTSRDLKLLLFVDRQSEVSYGGALRNVLPALQIFGEWLKVVFADPSTARHAALLPHYGSNAMEAHRLNRHGDAVVVGIRGGAALDGARKWRSMPGHFTVPNVVTFARKFVAEAAADAAAEGFRRSNSNARSELR